MPNLLTRNLASSRTCQTRTGLVDQLCAHTKSYRAGRDLIKEGDRPEDVFFLVHGWAYRYKTLQDGGRQILAYLLPGDLCDIHIFILNSMDHSIGLLSNATVAEISRDLMLSTMQEYPTIGRALFWTTLVDEAVLREWLVNIGRRNALERLAHLFCELWFRLDQVGLTTDGEFLLPLTQEQLGDTEGLTSVHVNRTLQRMRSEGLVTVGNKHITIHDIERLKRIAGFSPNYLHLNRRN